MDFWDRDTAQWLGYFLPSKCGGLRFNFQYEWLGSYLYVILDVINTELL